MNFVPPAEVFLKHGKGHALTLICGFFLSAGAVVAETCTFTTECFEAENCSETDFSMIVDRGKILTDAETIPVTRGGSDEVAVYVGFSGSAFHLLTHNANGFARYTTHIFSGPMVVSYLGECSR